MYICLCIDIYIHTYVESTKGFGDGICTISMSKIRTDLLGLATMEQPTL